MFARAADFNACGDSVVVVVEVLGKKTLIKKDRSEIECFQVQVADTSGRMVVSFFDGTRGLLLGGWVGDGAFRYWKYLMLRRGSRAYGKFCVLVFFWNYRESFVFFADRLAWCLIIQRYPVFAVYQRAILIGPVFLFFDDWWQLVFAAFSEFLFIAEDGL